MNNFLQLLDKGSAQILAPLKRFPFASFVAFIFLLMVGIKSALHRFPLNEYDNVMEKVAMISALGFFFLIGLRLMAKNFILPLLGIFMLVGIYFYLPEDLKDFISNEEGKVFYPMLIAGLISFLIVAPFLKHKASNREFFTWLKAFFYAVLLTIVLSVFVLFSLKIGMEIVSGLFEIGNTYEYVEYLATFTFAFFAPYLFLSLIPKDPRDLPIKSYNKIENFFFKYILTGLFIAYFIIIYVYLGKMLMLSEYPKGMVSINIMAFSALALMTYLFWTPLWNEKNSKYKKIIWIAILLQVILLAVALYLRVDAYGWTFGRLLLASVGIWLFVLSLYALFKKEISFKGIFLALPLIIILNLLFASSISKSSQQEKFSNLLGSVETLSDDSNISLRYNISSTIDYLHSHHGTDALFALMPHIVSEFNNQASDDLNNCAIPVNTNFPMFATEKMGFKYIDKWEWQQHIRYNENIERYQMKMKRLHSSGDPVAEGLDISEYHWIGRFNYYKSDVFSAVLVCEPTNSSNVKQLYTIKTKAKEIIIEEEKIFLSKINIEEFLESVLNLPAKDKTIYTSFSDRFTQEDFTHLYEDEGIKVKVIFNSLSFTLKDELIDYRGLILIGKK